MLFIALSGEEEEEERREWRGGEGKMSRADNGGEEGRWEREERKGAQMGG